MRFIYKATNTVTLKCYIGQTFDTTIRWRDHLKSARGDCRFKFAASIRKHGPESFVFEVIEECEDHLANEREVFWIAHFDSFKHGYNSTTGGDCNYTTSDDTRKKISAAKTGTTLSDETKRKIGDAHRE